VRPRTCEAFDATRTSRAAPASTKTVQSPAPTLPGDLPQFESRLGAADQLLLRRGEDLQRSRDWRIDRVEDDRSWFRLFEAGFALEDRAQRCRRPRSSSGQAESRFGRFANIECGANGNGAEEGGGQWISIEADLAPNDTDGCASNLGSTHDRAGDDRSLHTAHHRAGDRDDGLHHVALGTDRVPLGEVRDGLVERESGVRSKRR
jgi:hypothetical protein